MTDDIVTRLRVNDCFEFPSCDDIKQEAADEIERLRTENTELVKMFKQVGVVAEMWQKTEDELIEIHHGKCAEQFAEQHDEIERLRTIGKELLDALTEMADKGMLPKITCRLRDAAQTMEEVLATDV